MLAKLSEALFVDTLRRYVAGLPDQTTGWLAGARDPVVSKSLAMLHSRVAPSVDHRRVRRGRRRLPIGAGRAIHAISVGSADGVLDRWRLRLAAQALTSSPRGVADIAAEVGYESEAAFNRAFKRLFGAPPARYRREHRSTDTRAAKAKVQLSR